MLNKREKKLLVVGALLATLMLGGCSQQERALVVGTGLGVAVASVVYDTPRYTADPYYIYNGRYYYGGTYRNGVYLFKGHHYRGGTYHRTYVHKKSKHYYMKDGYRTGVRYEKHDKSRNYNSYISREDRRYMIR
jgi:predicted small secreted protein